MNPPKSDDELSDTGEDDSLLAEVARAPAVQPPHERIGSRVGRYRLDALLGRGGMGDVYRAHDTRLDRAVALKLVRAHLSADPSRNARLLREARAAASLAHPNIVAMYDAGEDGATTYLAMEFVAGTTLRARMASGPLPIANAIAIAKGVAEALAAAHATRLLHRDLKPDNVMLDASGTVKVLDFGLAKSLTDEADDLGNAMTVTADGVVAGTPAYMSPEQLEARSLDARSDVFAFGVLLYEMLAGARPFAGDTNNAVIAAILRDEPKSLAAVRPEIPAALSELVGECLAKHPAERPASAAELVVRLATLDAPSAPRHPKRTRSYRRFGIAALLVAGGVGAATAWRARMGGHDTTTSSTAGPSSTASAPASRATVPRLEWARRAAEAPVVEGRRVTTSSIVAPRGVAISGDGKRVAWADAATIRASNFDDGSALVEYAAPPGTAFNNNASIVFAGSTLYGTASDSKSSNLYRFDAAGASLVRDRVDLIGVAHGNTNAVLVREESMELLDLAGGAPRDLGSAKGISRLALTDDGKTVIAALRATIDSPFTITRIDVDSGERRVLLSTRRLHQGGVVPLTIVGSDVVFTMVDWPPVGRGTSLWAVAMDGSSVPRALARFPNADALDLAISARGTKVIVETHRRSMRVQVGELREQGRSLAAIKDITTGHDQDRAAGWLDAKTMLFTSDRLGDTALFAQTLDDSEARLVARDETASVSLPAVQADGKGLLAFRVEAPADGNESSLARIVSIDKAGQQRVLPVPPLESPYVEAASQQPPINGSLRCARRSSRCLLFRARGAGLTWSLVEGAEIGHWDPPGGARAQALALAPDGETFAAADVNEALWLIDIRSGRAARMKTTVHAQRLDFMPDGQSVIASSAEDNGYSLWQVTLEGRSTALVSNAVGWLSFPQVAPDGKHLAFSRWDFPSDVSVYELRARDE